ncbi:MAG: hypothetical protein P8P45_01310 [Flavobacteriales bacterium]|nr:hypothetical protein [Flavobacteriales bacterium]
MLFLWGYGKWGIVGGGWPESSEGAFVVHTLDFIRLSTEPESTLVCPFL